MPQSEWENLASLLSLATAVIAAILLALRAVPATWIAPAGARFKSLAATPWVWFILLPAFSFILNIGITIHHGGIPRPKIHDEFSYLLAGDTFAHGRLTNPSPPFFEHFETPQEIMQPTRMSKYPPGQGLFIALGQVLTGMPITGIWISTAAACAGIYWMLLGFVPIPHKCSRDACVDSSVTGRKPEEATQASRLHAFHFSKSWALIGGLIATTSPTLLDWSQVYWGGCVAVLGGALLLGGWGRLMLRTTISASIMMAIGLAILANSRPFEGLTVSLPLLIALLIHARRRLARIVIPAAIILAITAAWMGYDNYRVTGHPLRLPFAEYTAQYDLYPKFWFQPLRPMPEYRNRSQRWVHTNFERGVYDQLHTVGGFVRIAEYRAGALISNNLKLAALFIPFAAAFFLLRDVRIRWAMISATVLLLALLAENFDLPHYSAPANPVLLLLVVAGMARLWQGRDSLLGSWRLDVERWKFNSERPTSNAQLPTSNERPERSLGKSITLAALIGFLAGTTMCIIEGVPRDSQIVEQQSLVDLQPALHTGRHIIFVEYGPMAELVNGFDNEYVYNSADLDDSRIIWARYFGPDADRPVSRNYAGRKVWILSINRQLELKPYPEQP